MRERYYQAVTRRHTGCAGAPRAGSKIRKQLDQCICKLEGAIVIATALVAAAQHAVTEWICILKGAFPADVSRAIQLADKPAWISAAEDDISLRRRHWVTSTATSRGRCSSSNRPTAEFQFLQILRRRVAAPGRERNPSAWVHSNQWGEAMPYPPTGSADSPPCLPHPRSLLQIQKIWEISSTNSATGTASSLYGRRSSFDPHGYPLHEILFWQN